MSTKYEPNTAESMHGSEISEVWFRGNGEAFNECVKSTDTKKLYFACQHHGTHDSKWVVAVENGKETVRYAADEVTSIHWKP